MTDPRETLFALVYGAEYDAARKQGSGADMQECQDRAQREAEKEASRAVVALGKWKQRWREDELRKPPLPADTCEHPEASRKSLGGGAIHCYKCGATIQTQGGG